MKESKFNYSMKGGHLMLPRTLLNAVFSEQTVPMEETMAFACVLAKVNYSDRKVNGRVVERGCSVLTQAQWGRCFGWGRTKTCRFFAELEAEGVIGIDRSRRPSLLRVLRYEEICANRRPAPEKEQEGRAMSKSDRLFEEFWENYHAVTQQMPVDKYGALKIWRKLPYAERILAAECVEQYYMSLPDVRHARKAINYLKDKSFILE